MNKIFVILILLCLLCSFFSFSVEYSYDNNSSVCSQTVETIQVFCNEKGLSILHTEDKQIMKIMAILDHYNSDLSLTEKYLYAKNILALQRKYKHIGIDTVKLLAKDKVETSFRHRNTKGKVLVVRNGRGISQLDVNTARGVASRHGIRWRDIYINDPAINTYIAGLYLADLKKEHKKDKFAFTSYNAGPINKQKINQFLYWQKIQQAMHELSTLLKHITVTKKISK